MNLSIDQISNRIHSMPLHSRGKRHLENMAREIRLDELRNELLSEPALAAHLEAVLSDVNWEIV